METFANLVKNTENFSVVVTNFPIPKTLLVIPKSGRTDRLGKQLQLCKVCVQTLEALGFASHNVLTYDCVPGHSNYSRVVPRTADDWGDHNDFYGQLEKVDGIEYAKTEAPLTSLKELTSAMGNIV